MVFAAQGGLVLAGQTVYIDTNVWLHYAGSPSDPLARVCSPFFQEMEHGNFTPIVSTFVTQEFLGLSKEMLAARKGSSPTSDESQQISDFFDRLLDSFGVEIFDADALSLDAAAGQGLFRRSGEIAFSASVSRKGLQSQGGGEWVHLGGADALHAALAEQAGATRLATCDYGFRGLQAGLTAVVLMDAYP